MLILSCFSGGPGKNKPADSIPATPTPSEKISKKQDSSSSSASANLIEFGLLKDSRDGKKYKTIAIGTQTWMAENLAYNAKGSKCYNNESANCNKYGRLYSWETISENKSICPDGWQLPNNTEWNILADYAGGEKNAGKKLKAKNGWNNFEKASGNGTDNYGFAALPGGHGSREGKFNYIGDLGLWWSDNLEVHSEFASNWYINARGNIKNNDYFEAHESFFSSIRCIKRE
jgi:uncharacterized protein (TIGR02145 family)